MKNVFKVVGVIGAITGTVGSLLGAYSEKKQQEEYISKEVDRQLSEREKKEEEDPE